MSCSFHGCSREVFSKTLCQGHYRQQWRGLPMRPLGLPVHQRGGGSKSSTWKGNDITYSAAHSRVRALHGPATDHACMDCGEEAQQWSYVGGCPDERESPEGWKYSPNPHFYMPFCLACHREYDGSIRGVEWVFPEGSEIPERT